MDRALPRGWFDLQLGFGRRVAAVGGGRFEEGLARQTNLYRCLGLPWEMDLGHPVWVEFVEGLLRAEDAVAWAYGFYRERWREYGVRPFGCFRYDFEPEGTWIRLHFSNQDGSGEGAISKARMEVRLAELRAMFGEIARDYPEATEVRGNSWLYGREAYRRLYPPAFCRVLTPARTEDNFQYLALWGQFLDREKRVKLAMAGEFLERIGRAQTMEELAAAFPQRVYSAACGIAEFYDFYRIDRDGEAG